MRKSEEERRKVATKHILQLLMNMKRELKMSMLQRIIPTPHVIMGWRSKQSCWGVLENTKKKQENIYKIDHLALLLEMKTVV